MREETWWVAWLGVGTAGMAAAADVTRFAWAVGAVAAAGLAVFLLAPRGVQRGGLALVLVLGGLASLSLGAALTE